jgi:hypothetical protein
LRLSATIVVLISLCAFSEAADTGSFGELLDLGALMLPHDGVAYQASSYDRTGGNDDGDIKKNMSPRKEGDGYVVFDEQGPGCIYRIWSASATGWIRLYFDGETEPRISLDNFGELFGGNYPPFIRPVSTAFLGGAVSYVPIPFAKSCKIVMELPKSAAYLQITWRKFTSSVGVRTFTRELPPDEKPKLDQVVAAWSKPGEPPVAFGSKCRTVAKPISASAPVVPLAELKKSGIVRALRLKLKSPDPLFLRKVVLRITTDGQKTPDVWSPVGDFFMTGFGGIETRGLVIGVKDGQMYSYFPMPFEKGMRIELVNESGSSLSGTAEIVYEPVQSLPKGALRFHAWWRRQNPTIAGEPFPILEASGSGHWCGLSLYMEDPGGLGFLEGDEQLWIDGRDKSHYHGTGTEDYFNCGWYFGTAGCQPLYGCTIRTEAPSYVHAYRVHVSDLVPFTREARIAIEHGPVNDRNGDYSGVTYWYASKGSTHGFVPVPARDRLPTPMTILKATEAEKAVAGTEGGKAERIDEVKLPLRLSACEAIRFTPTADSATVSFKVKAQDDSGYDALAWLLAGPSGGKAQVLIDGGEAGPVFDTYSPRSKLQRLVVGGSDKLAAGEHSVSFVSRGKSAASKGRDIVVDCLRLARKGVLEGEDLKVLDKTPDRLLPQELHIEHQYWSDDMQLWFLPGGPKTYFTLEMPVEKAGLYEVSAFMTKAIDYGIVQFKLDGKVVGEPFDGYNAGIVRSLGLDVVMDLSAGNHAFTVEVIGKNPKSGGYLAGLDCIDLTPAP